MMFLRQTKGEFLVRNVIPPGKLIALVPQKVYRNKWNGTLASLIQDIKL